MPFYDFECPECGNHEVAYRHISERHNGPTCCEKVMALVILPTYVAPDLPGYESPVTGKWVEGRVQRNEDLKRTGCRPYEGREAETSEWKRQQSYQEKKQDAARHEQVARMFYSLPEAKRRALTRG